MMVAFSGGVDSAFLLAVAHDVLKDNVVAVTAVSQIHPAREKKKAMEFVKNYGLKHIMLQSAEMNLPAFLANRKDRCYVCKKNLFEKLIKMRALARLGGGQERIDKQHAKGRMTARERVEMLLDEGSFEEFDMFKTHRCHNFGMEKKIF